MSHHYSGPNWGFPRGDARLDLTDLYAFPKPGDARKSILIMNVHPSIGENPPGPTTLEPFASETLYEFDIDTNGDSVADIAYQVRFSRFENGSQNATLYRLEGATAIKQCERGQLIVDGAPVSTGRQPQVTQAGHYQFFAGWRSDPFFFDRRGALNNLQFTGADFFANADICSIALEVPNADLLSGAVGLWGRTLVRASGVGEGWAQAERGAWPLLAAFLVGGLSDAEQEAYFAGDPADDARYVDSFAHALEHTGAYAPAEALRVAKTLLPEILPYDPSRPACFPHNGRTLTDDAAGAFLTVLTNGRVTGDNVRPHNDLLAEFPYLGPPHGRTVSQIELE